MRHRSDPPARPRPAPAPAAAERRQRASCRTLRPEARPSMPDAWAIGCVRLATVQRRDRRRVALQPVECRLQLALGRDVATASAGVDADAAHRGGGKYRAAPLVTQ